MNQTEFRKQYEDYDMDRTIFCILKRNRIIIRISDDCWSWATHSYSDIYRNNFKEIREFHEKFLRKEIKKYEVDREIICNIFHKGK